MMNINIGTSREYREIHLPFLQREIKDRTNSKLLSKKSRLYVHKRDNKKPTPIDKSSVETRFVAETLLPTRNGLYRLRGYRHTLDDWKTIVEPTAIICGEVEGQTLVPLRVHDACFTSEVLGSMKCDCAEQLEIAMEYIQKKPPGLIIYLQQEGRGIGLANKIAAYALQESGLDTVDANRALGLPDDNREYTAVQNIVNDLEIQSVLLMTNNPRKISSLKELGVSVEGRIPCLAQAGALNKTYLESKEKRMDHLLEGSWCFWNHEGGKNAHSLMAPRSLIPQNEVHESNTSSKDSKGDIDEKS